MHYRRMALWTALLVVIPVLTGTCHSWSHNNEHDSDEEENDRQRDRTHSQDQSQTQRYRTSSHSNNLWSHDGSPSEIFMQTVLMTIRRKCSDLKCGDHGKCALFATGHTACVCDEDDKYVYGGRQCTKKGEVLPVPSEYIIGLCMGVIILLVITLIILYADSHFKCRKRDRRRGNTDEEANQTNTSSRRRQAFRSPTPPYDVPGPPAPPYEEFELYRVSSTPTPPYEEMPSNSREREQFPLASDEASISEAVSDATPVSNDAAASFDTGVASETASEIDASSGDVGSVHRSESQQSAGLSESLETTLDTQESSLSKTSASAAGTLSSFHGTEASETTSSGAAASPSSYFTLDNFPKTISVDKPLHFKKPFVLPRINLKGTESKKEERLACEDTLSELSDIYNNRPLSEGSRSCDDLTGLPSMPQYTPVSRTYRVLIMGSLGPEPVFLYEPWRSADGDNSSSNSQPVASPLPPARTQDMIPPSSPYGHCTDTDLDRYVPNLLSECKEANTNADFLDSLSDSSGDTIVARSTKSDYSRDESSGSDTTLVYAEDSDSDTDLDGEQDTVVKMIGLAGPQSGGHSVLSGQNSASKTFDKQISESKTSNDQNSNFKRANRKRSDSTIFDNQSSKSKTNVRKMSDSDTSDSEDSKFALLPYMESLCLNTDSSYKDAKSTDFTVSTNSGILSPKSTMEYSAMKTKLACMRKLSSDLETECSDGKRDFSDSDTDVTSCTDVKTQPEYSARHLKDLKTDPAHLKTDSKTESRDSTGLSTDVKTGSLRRNVEFPVERKESLNAGLNVTSVEQSHTKGDLESAVTSQNHNAETYQVCSENKTGSNSKQQIENSGNVESEQAAASPRDKPVCENKTRASQSIKRDALCHQISSAQSHYRISRCLSSMEMHDCGSEHTLCQGSIDDISNGEGRSETNEQQDSECSQIACLEPFGTMAPSTHLTGGNLDTKVVRNASQETDYPDKPHQDKAFDKAQETRSNGETRDAFISESGSAVPWCQGCCSNSSQCTGRDCVRVRQSVPESVRSLQTASSDHTQGANETENTDVTENCITGKAQSNISAGTPPENIFRHQPLKGPRSNSEPFPPGSITLGDSGPEDSKSPSPMLSQTAPACEQHGGIETFEIEVGCSARLSGMQHSETIRTKSSASGEKAHTVPEPNVNQFTPTSPSARRSGGRYGATLVKTHPAQNLRIIPDKSPSTKLKDNSSKSTTETRNVNQISHPNASTASRSTSEQRLAGETTEKQSVKMRVQKFESENVYSKTHSHSTKLPGEPVKNANTKTVQTTPLETRTKFL